MENNNIERLKLEVEKGFSKTYLEKVIGLPKNSLASYISGVKPMTKANLARIDKFFRDNPSLDILSMPRRTREIKSKNKVEVEKKPIFCNPIVGVRVRPSLENPIYHINPLLD